MSNVTCILRTFLLVLLLGFLATCALVCHAAPLAAPDAEALLKRKLLTFQQAPGAKTEVAQQ